LERSVEREGGGERDSCEEKQMPVEKLEEEDALCDMWMSPKI
jgi:hypothetical protein